MSIKDEINKSFKVGNLITNNYADKAEINVKEFYELDKLNRGRTLQLAGMTDIELAKINGDLGTKDLKLKEIEEKLEELEATGGSSEGTSQKAYYDALLSFSSFAYIFHKFTVPQEDLDTLTGVLTLDKYNLLSVSDKADVGKILEREGITDPTDLVALAAELEKNNSQAGALIIKIYLNSIRLPVDKTFTFIQTDRLGLSKRSVKTDIMDIVLTKLPNSSYDSTHSTIVRNTSSPKLNSIHAFKNYPGYDVSSNLVKVVNILDAEQKATNQFGVCIEGAFGTLLEAPYYVGGSKLEKLSRLEYHTVNHYYANPTAISVSVSNTLYGDMTKFTTRSVSIVDYSKFLAFDIKVKYNVNITASITLMDNIPNYYFPFYATGYATTVDIPIYGSDGSVTKVQLVGSSSSSTLCKIVHYGTLTSGVTYTAGFQLRGGFQ